MGKMRIKEEVGGESVTKPFAFKRAKRRLEEANIYIQSTFNNTIISLTDKKGGVFFWSSAGRCGFKGTRQGTPYAASVVANTVVEAAKEAGVKKISLFIKGVGQGRDQALRTIAAGGFEIEEIKDLTPLPHNGPRPKNPRRV